MLGGNALVAEDAADLVDALHPAHEQPLQMQLGGDAEVEVRVEGVVVGDEGPGERAAGDALQDGRLDFEEAAGVEEAAERADHLWIARRRSLDTSSLADQIEVALTVADFDVAQAVPFLGEGAERLGEESQFGNLYRHLPGTGANQRSGRAHQVAQIEVAQPAVGLFAEGIGAKEQLHAAGAVAEVGEGGLAVAAEGQQASRDADGWPSRASKSRCSTAASWVRSKRVTRKGSWPAARRWASVSRRAATWSLSSSLGGSGCWVSSGTALSHRAMRTGTSPDGLSYAPCPHGVH